MNNVDAVLYSIVIYHYSLQMWTHKLIIIIIFDIQWLCYFLFSLARKLITLITNGDGDQ